MKKHVKLFFFLLTVLPPSLFAQQSKMDSLFAELKKWQNKSGYGADTTLNNIYYNLGIQFQKFNPDTAIYFFKQTIIKAKSIKDAIKEAESVNQLGRCFYVKGDFNLAMQQYERALKVLPENVNEKDKIRKQKVYAIILVNIGTVYASQGNYVKALEYYFKALKINEEIGNKQGQSANIGNIGLVYSDQGNYAKALDYFFRAQKIDEEIGNKQYQATNLGNIGNVYASQGNYVKALEYHFKALKICEEIGDKKNQATILGNIGLVYSDQGNYAKALDYFFKALKINKELGRKQGQAVNLVNIGTVYEDQGNYTKALEYYFKAQKIDEEIGDKQGQAINLGNIGSLYFNLKKYKEAEEYLKKAIAIGEELHIIYHLEDFYNSLSELYSKTGRDKDALEAYKKHVMWKDSVNSEENKKALATKEMQYLFEKKQAEEQAKFDKMMALAEAEKKRQQIFIWFVTICLILMIAFLGVTFYTLQITKKQKRIIEEARDEIARQKEEVEKQKQLVEEKNKEITDSILYARRIQDAILPDEDLWKKLLPDSFVLYLPKDIVAGDFYWLVETAHYIFVASADCTGHGVPGAMVSVTCHNALNKAVLEEGLQNTNEILNQTREIVIKQLQSQQQGQLQDGMDICLVRINKKNRLQIQYSGANRPLVVIKDSLVTEYAPDKQPIGYYEQMQSFTAQDIQLTENTCMCLFTDGYTDQFGGERNKKLGSKRLKELLSEISAKDTQEQRTFLKQYFEEWKGTREQMDDVTIIGVRV
jgi:tetratricopeptide (TPR) repeat protein